MNRSLPPKTANGLSEALRIMRAETEDWKMVDLQQPPDRMSQLVWTILAALGAVLLLVGLYRYLSG